MATSFSVLDSTGSLLAAVGQHAYILLEKKGAVGSLGTRTFPGIPHVQCAKKRAKNHGEALLKNSEQLKDDWESAMTQSCWDVSRS